MTTIKTTLRTHATDKHGNITLNSANQPKAFDGIFALGLIIGSQDDQTRRFPVDDNSLLEVKRVLTNTVNDCLFKLAGLGGFISLCEPTVPLTNNELYGVGSIINDLALLAQESQDHIESIELDIARRKEGSFKPKCNVCGNDGLNCNYCGEQS